MIERLPRIAICGPGECGKDSAAIWIAAHTPLRLGKTTSQVILPHYATRHGISEEQAWAERRENREAWAAEGDRLREHDPAYLVRETLRDGEICAGIRRRVEFQAAKLERLADLFVWIDRERPCGKPVDTTMGYWSEDCDVTIDNNGTLDELYARLEALARFAGLLKEAA